MFTLTHSLQGACGTQHRDPCHRAQLLHLPSLGYWVETCLPIVPARVMKDWTGLAMTRADSGSKCRPEAGVLRRGSCACYPSAPLHQIPMATIVMPDRTVIAFIFEPIAGEERYEVWTLTTHDPHQLRGRIVFYSLFDCKRLLHISVRHSLTMMWRNHTADCAKFAEVSYRQ